MYSTSTISNDNTQFRAYRLDSDNDEIWLTDSTRYFTLCVSRKEAWQLIEELKRELSAAMVDEGASA